MLFPRLLGPDGKSYTFDSRANGYGRGEGSATIILKRLDDAIRDGDPIRAVIRGSAVNQDGKTETITSPSQEAQEELIRMCYRNAGLDPSQTTYFEAHGTGKFLYLALLFLSWGLETMVFHTARVAESFA
jgi:acyl transferase domain-containing protein